MPLSTRQTRISARLDRLVGPGPAAFYRDACRLLGMTSPVESVTHIAGHCIREIESAVRAVALRFASTPVPPCTPRRHLVEVESILNVLGIPGTGDSGRFWRAHAERGNEFGFHARAHRDSLRRPRARGTEYDAFIEGFTRFLEDVLDGMEARYATVFERLDTLLARPPGRNAVSDLLNVTPDTPVARTYFFDRLTEADWLRPLDKRGLFRDPPGPEYNEETQAVGYPSWPQSGYLARVAGRSQAAAEAVADIVLCQVGNTENTRIQEDLVAAAIAMPASVSVRLVELVGLWVQRPYHVRLPREVCKLVARLADGGQGQAALELCRSLLAVRRDPRSGEEPEEHAWPLPPEAHAWFDPVWYRDAIGILNSARPPLLGVKFLRVLCDLLDQALQLSARHEHPDAADTYSPIWRRAIEDHREYDPHDIKDILVSAVRDSATALIETGTDVAEVQGCLEEHGSWTHVRIALHLMRKFPGRFSDVIPETLATAELMHNSTVEREYLGLLRDQYSGLAGETQSEILGLIDAGLRASGSPAASADLERLNRYWQRDRLHLIQAHLPPDWQVRHQALVSDLGDPGDPGDAGEGVWVGPTSPLSATELSPMPVENIIARLGEWQPDGGIISPSREGLAREVERVAAERSVEFSSEASAFIGSDATYVRAVISGLKTATANGQVVDWSETLVLCAWVVARDRDIPGRDEGQRGEDPHWGWTRKAIASLLAAGFRNNALPFDLRATAWHVLEPITDDPDPHDDADMGDRYTAAINSVRGTALETVLEYAAWCRRNLDRADTGQEFTLDRVSEARDVLSRHLNESEDTSLAVRAVYGIWFPRLYVLDRDWATGNQRRIFPLEPEAEDLFRAAWSAYINYSAAYDDLFRTLSQEYGRAVETVGTWPENRPPRPDEGLAKHLVVLHARGQTVAADSRRLHEGFWANAPDPLRARAVFCAGRMLGAGPVSQDALERLLALWEGRAAEIQAGDPGEHSHELAAFGSWFSSGRFDAAWSLEQLAAVMKLLARVPGENGAPLWPLYNATEHLERYVADHPAATLECVAALLELSGAALGLGLWMSHVRAVLDAARGHADGSIRQRATELANRCVAYGDESFRDLSEPPDPEAE